MTSHAGSFLSGRAAALMLAAVSFSAQADLYQFTFTDPVGTRTVSTANSNPLPASQACSYYFKNFRGNAVHRWGTSPSGTATWQSSGATSRTFVASSSSDVASCPQSYLYDPCGCGNPGQQGSATATVITLWQGASNAPTPVNTGAPPPGACVANPVNVATGNKFEEELDYAAAGGTLALEFRRYYSSDLPRRGDLSYQWTHSYSARVDLDATVARITRPDGKVLSFQFNSGSGLWVPASDVTYTLTRLFDGLGQPAGWKVADRSNVSESYDVSGRLTQRQHPSGFAQTVSYDAAGHLQSVADSWGRALTFEYSAFQYDADRITAFIDPANQRYEYAYDAASNLESVTYPGATIRTYHYEDANHPHALTGITDENSVRFATWQYDTYGRAISATHAGDADDFTLTHNTDGTTVVTDPLGKSRTYAFDYTLGVYRVQELSEPCAGNQDAASDYDANGFIASRTDFNGNVTTYVHNARGLEESRTEAFGTALARTITTQWHATLRLPTQIDEPGRRTVYTYDANGNRETETITDTATSASRTTTWTYTALGLIDTVNGPRTDVSDVTDFDYDAQGNLVQIKNALNQITSIPEHDAHGNPKKIVDANGVQTLLTYDARQRLKTRTVAGAMTTYDYDGLGQLDKVTLPDGSFVDYTYDVAHRLTDIEDI
jgi:YD repeat-containing protein